ncbi:phosphatidate cytidylyltransferase [Clostridium sp.]|uniref:phosphatidate cytidylyltransferase n=1 Tax=Clostridium sp. TaxID=1506 RepID=UPI002638A6BD|nr:phosphatidate cytidylyltransferase [Clostridium sp.]
MKLNSRYLGALFIAPFILFVFLGGTWLKAFTFVISICGLYEFYKALKVKGFRPIPIFGYGLLLIFYILGIELNKIMYIFILLSVLLMTLPIINIKYTFIDISISILGFLYVGILFSFIPMVSDKVNGEYLVWLIFIGSWMADTLAYYSGKYLGKKKLCPEVSPNKTIAGSIGGFIGSVLGCGIYGYLVPTNILLIHFILIGALCGIMGQFGDLVASSIKRYVGIKDYSNLIPGHGGILDRFDSILFNSLVVFYYLTFIVNI